MTLTIADIERWDAGDVREVFHAATSRQWQSDGTAAQAAAARAAGRCTDRRGEPGGHGTGQRHRHGQRENSDTPGGRCATRRLPPEPSKFAEASRALSEGSFGIIPDVAKTADVLTDWGERSGAEQAGAVLDLAGMVPLPGGKLVTEGIEQELDALGTAARHTDDIPTPHVDVDDVPTGGGAPTIDTPGTTADEIGSIGPYSFEDTSALLAASEASGGHLIERHVGQTFDDLSARLEARPSLDEVSTFPTRDEAAAAVSNTLQYNQSAVDAWVANGSPKKLILTAPFDGGEVLMRGTTETTAGSSARVVLKGDGKGNWYVLTGYLEP